MIPQAAPWRRIARHRARIDAAIAATLESKHYILGPEVERFEADFAAFATARHCIGVASGTDALALALKALDVGYGDEVITVSMTAAATACAIKLTGATPRLVDIDLRTRCMDVSALEAAITSRTVAIVPVHLHGSPADMPAIMEVARKYRLAVVEDCAQAHGAHIANRSVGTFGDAGAYSFYPTKNLGCVGDGGAVVTSDTGLAAKIRALRTYGWNKERESLEYGWNSRLDEIQAAILNVLLPELPASNDERVEISRIYREGLTSLATVGLVALPVATIGSVLHQFVIVVERRDPVRKSLLLKGVQTGVHYSPALHQQPAFAEYASSLLPVTETLSAGCISLPIQPEAVGDSAREIVAAVSASILCECRL